jgi:threonylcarbamoyladenosine tRNA methylthiotransferase MtaB
MPHLHLSLQSGDDLTLKRMKRRHGRADSVRFCAEMRRARPDMVFGADLIAGFPTETETMFENSLSLVDDCGLTFLHVFPFSAREGTPAARMPQINGAVIQRRAGELRAKGLAALKAHLASANGRRIQVLMESAHQGRSPDFTPVRLDGGDTGALVEAIVAGHDETALLAVAA